MTKVQRTGAPDIDYIVDGKGRRIGKRKAASPSTPALDRRWIYRDGLNPVAEIDGVTGSTIARYVYGSRSNVPDLVVRDGNTYRIIVDQLGSPRMAINVANSADVPYRADYTSFGTQVAVGTTSLDWIPFGFSGGMSDPDTGIVRFGARDYDPKLGRWLSKDPIRFEGDGGNLYAYVLNEPVNYSDPTGTQIAVPVAPGPVIGLGVGAGLLACALSNECRDFFLKKFRDFCDGNTGRPPSRGWCLDASLEGPVGWGAFCDSFGDYAMRAKCHSKTYESDQERTNWCYNYF